MCMDQVRFWNAEVCGLCLCLSWSSSYLGVCLYVDIYEPPFQSQSFQPSFLKSVDLLSIGVDGMLPLVCQLDVTALHNTCVIIIIIITVHRLHTLLYTVMSTVLWQSLRQYLGKKTVWPGEERHWNRLRSCVFVVAYYGSFLTQVISQQKMCILGL